MVPLYEVLIGLPFNANGQPILLCILCAPTANADDDVIVPLHMN